MAGDVACVSIIQGMRRRCVPERMGPQSLARGFPVRGGSAGAVLPVTMHNAVTRAVRCTIQSNNCSRCSRGD